MTLRSKDQRTVKPSLATRLYSNLPSQTNQVNRSMVGHRDATSAMGRNVDHVTASMLTRVAIRRKSEIPTSKREDVKLQPERTEPRNGSM